MPSLSSHQSSSATKVMVIGDSGTGKTGALFSLIKAGYNLKIWDYDNGLDILVGVIRDQAKSDKALEAKWLSQVQFVTLTDRMKVVNGRLVPIQAVAWGNGVAAFEKWPDGGKIEEWGSNDVAVIDSLTFAGKACMRWIQQMNGRLNVAPQIQDYWDAQRQVESLCATLYDSQVKCNVVVLSHIREVGKSETKIVRDARGNEKPITVVEEGSKKGYAETGTGNALSPNIGRYFNGVLSVQLLGSGMSIRREIVTQPIDNIGLKNPAPGLVKRVYPLETGLAEYFAAVRGGAPSANSAS